MRVLLIAESDKDLWKQKLIRERILESFLDASVIIACGETDPSKHWEDSAVVYVLAGADMGDEGEAGARDLRERLKRQTRDYDIPSNYYKADRRFALGTMTSQELGLEQACIVDGGHALIDDFDPHAIFMAGGASVVRTLFCDLGNQLGIPTYRLIVTNYLNPQCEGRRIWLCTNNRNRLSTGQRDRFYHDESACWQHVDALIESLAAPANKLDTTARERRSSRIAFGAQRLAKCAARALVDFVVRKVTRGRRRRYNAGWMPLHSRWNYERNKGLSIEPESLKDSYVVFPLSIPLEAQTAMRAPQYQDQIATCAMIANVLPHDCHLVVREHPGWPGTLDHGRLKRLLRRHENILYVSGDKPMPALMDNAAALITVNSTSAVEAALRRIPVIVLGEAFYRGTGLGFDVEYFYDLRKLLSRIVAGEGREDKTELLRRLFFNFLMETFPPPGEKRFPHDTPAGSIELSADAIIAKLELIAPRHEGSDRGVAAAVIDGPH